MAGVALRNSDETEMPAVASLLADSNVLPNGKPESDTYQVASGEVRFGQIRADFSSMEVTRGEQPVALTAQEFQALAFLVDNRGRVISQDELLNEVWGYDNYPCTRTVDNLVLRLRQKLEPDPSRPVHFLTVHRVGYKFVP
jgi:DNA-binding response OmpR family regulator